MAFPAKHFLCDCGERWRVFHNRDGLRILECPMCPKGLEKILAFLRCEYGESVHIATGDRAFLKEMGIKW